MILNRNLVIWLNSLKSFKLPYPLSANVGFTRLPLMFTIWVSFRVFFPVLVPWMFYKLRVTSPLLIVFDGREESHWVLIILLFILKCELIQVNVMKKCRCHLQATREFGVFPVIPPPHLLYWETFPSSHLSKAKHDLCSIGMPIIIWCDESGESDT